MFGNFIYFIVALLIFATYQPADRANFSPSETAGLFLSLIFFFIAVTRFIFLRIEKRIGLESPRLTERRFTAAQLRLSVFAVVVFALDIYALSISDFIARLPLLGQVPTFQAVISMALFTGHLAIVWWFSHDVYRRLYPSPLGRGGYVASNISFAVPVLLPWVILSTVTDIIYALPLDPLKHFLYSPQGELLFVLFFLGAIAVIGPAMIQRFWGCKPLPASHIRHRIENICREAGVSYRNIVEWPVFGGHMITAGVMGLVGRFRYILVTRGLLAHLTGEELDAVIAHEIGHVKKHHLSLYLLFLVGYMLIAYTAYDIIVYALLYSTPSILLVSGSGADPGSGAPLLLSVFMVAFFLLYFRFIFGYFMRNFERQADSYAFSMFGTAAPLISTFRKIAYTSGQAPDKPNWHHFSISQRIDFLERCEGDRRLIDRHNRKVHRNMSIFLIALVAVGFAGYHLNFGTTGQKISSHMLEDILHREIERAPDDAQLLAILGDLYFSRNDYPGTIDAYERALSINFDTPYVLNNLAWLYATCEDTSFRNPRRALFLSIRAAELEETPEILDTLAESYFINGEYENAMAAGTKALELAGGNRHYHEEQLGRFEAAMKGQTGIGDSR
jgi:Zn-dependent protease with chaperone function